MPEFNHSPSDRMQLAGLGELLSPATCMHCGSGTCEQGYVRLGVWYEFEGEQYLCRNCCVQAAELLGCLTPDEAQHLQEQATMLAAQNEIATRELEDARERLVVFDRAISNVAADLNLASLHDADSEANAKQQPTSSGMDEPVVIAADTTVAEPVKPTEGTKPTGTNESELQHDRSNAGAGAPRL